MRVELKVWNVGHGEAMRIDFGDELSVVRDFGRHRQAKKTSTSVEVADVIEAPLIAPGRETVAVLSHAHDDHFNGFSALHERVPRRVFSECYIPWLDFRTTDSLGWKVQTLGTYLFAYNTPGSIEAVTTENWSRAAPLMAGLGGAVRGVAAGFCFPWPGRSNKVLWPPAPSEINWLGNQRRLASRALDRIRNQLEKDDLWNVVAPIEGAARAISEILAPYYNVEYRERSLTEARASGELAEVNRQLESVRDLHVSHTSGLTRTFAAASSSRRSLLDDHSIVFEAGHHALFLSDLRNGSMNLMARRYMLGTRCYRLVKSAHHGTRLGRSGLRNAVKKAGMVLHCCGPANPRIGAPIGDYRCFAPEYIISTDHRPERDSLSDGIPRLCFNAPQVSFDL